jgi:hypothetical protein
LKAEKEKRKRMILLSKLRTIKEFPSFQLVAIMVKRGHIKCHCPLSKKRYAKENRACISWDDKNKNASDESKNEVAYSCFMAKLMTLWTEALRSLLTGVRQRSSISRGGPVKGILSLHFNFCWLLKGLTP